MRFSLGTGGSWLVSVGFSSLGVVADDGSLGLDQTNLAFFEVVDGVVILQELSSKDPVLVVFIFLAQS